MVLEKNFDIIQPFFPTILIIIVILIIIDILVVIGLSLPFLEKHIQKVLKR